MDNPEIQATLGTRHRTKTSKKPKNIIQKTKKMSNTEPTKIPWVNSCPLEVASVSSYLYGQVQEKYCR
jgi:hypothetical protein